MIKKVLSSFLFMIIVILFYSNTLEAAQAEFLQIRNMDVKLLPEYNSHDVLVMYGIKFINRNDQIYNEEISVPVPKGSFNIIVKEMGNSSDTSLAFRVLKHSHYDEVVWKPRMPIPANSVYEIHLKHYYQHLAGSGHKTFLYELHANTGIELTKLFVYQPLRSTEFLMEPQGQPYGITKEGFQIFGLTAQDLKKGEKIDVNVSYAKNDSKPSIQYYGLVQNPLSHGLKPGLSLFIIGGAILAVLIILFRSIIRRRQPSEDPLSFDRSLIAFSQEKRRLRQQFLDDQIDEETYHKMLRELEEETF